MKISDIVAKLTGLEARATEQFKAELAELQSTVKSTLAGLEADLATANASIESLGKEKAELAGKVESLSTAAAGADTKLNEAIAALKIESKSDATAVEKISALETFAKVAGEKAGGHKAEEIPAGGVKSPAADSKNFTERCKAAKLAAK